MNTIVEKQASRPRRKNLSLKKTTGLSKISCHMTPVVVSQASANSKVRKKLFFIPPRIISSELKYVPCWKIVLDFTVVYFSKKNVVEGRLDFIVDEVKGCSLVEESLKIKLERRNIEPSIVVPFKYTQEEAVKKAVIDARWKVVLGRYKKPPELQLVSTQVFYRPYYKIEYTFGDKIEVQWIAADDYGNYLAYR